MARYSGARDKDKKGLELLILAPGGASGRSPDGSSVSCSSLLPRTSAYRPPLHLNFAEMSEVDQYNQTGGGGSGGGGHSRSPGRNHGRVPEVEMIWSADEDFGVKQEQAIVFRFCDVSHASTPG